VKALTHNGNKSPKLVVFDVEGVIIPKNRLFFDVAKSIGALQLLKLLFYGFLYEIGILPLKQALSRIFWVIRGKATKDLLLEKLGKLPLMPNAQELFAELKAQDRKTALISSGLPTFLVERIASLVGADYAVGVEIGVENGVLTGEVWGDVTERNGKYLVLKKLMEDQHVTASECAVVADDRNNASLFLKDTLKIGYDPDYLIRIKADVVVSGKLTKITPLLNHMTKPTTLSCNDALREIIHASGLFIPIIAVLFGLVPTVAFILVVAALYSISELLRIRGKNMPFFSLITRLAASQSELCQFTFAPLYFAIGILLTLVLFPPPANYAAIAVFTLGDSAASLVGRRISKKPMPFNRAKTLEGTLAGFSFALLAAAIFVNPQIALIGAAVGMLVEYLPLPINDNLLMPLTAGLVFTFLL
jgi:dolichol kinase